jgi:hypothetical protein
LTPSGSNTVPQHNSQSSQALNFFTSSSCAFNCFGKPSTDPTVCSGNGNCTFIDTCTCKSGFTGSQCETAPIFTCFGKQSNDPKVCSGNGTCVATNICNCINGHTGNQCQMEPVFNCFGKQSNDPKSCSGFGSCVGNNTCSCPQGFTGNECQNTPLNCRSFSSGHKLQYRIVGSNIQFNFTLPNSIQITTTQGWIAVGFNSDGNTMIGASIIMAYGPSNINEYVGSAFSRPTLSNQQRLKNTKIVSSDSKITQLQFERPITDAFDLGYFTLKNQNQAFLFSYNDQTLPTSNSVFTKHVKAQNFSMNFFIAQDNCLSSSSSSWNFSFLTIFFMVLFLIFSS